MLLLLPVRVGNIRTVELTKLLKQHLPAIFAALDQNSLVELDLQAVKVIG